MARRDHSLDERIVEAAREEFLAHGFRGASVHDIAAHAGVTTGALYTRYHGKDELFCGLVQDVVDEVLAQGERLAAEYGALTADSGADEFIAVCDREAQAIAALLRHHYEACVLVLCRSEGTTLADRVRALFEMKAQGTVDFMRRIGGDRVDEDVVRLMIVNQLHLIREIVGADLGVERATHSVLGTQHYLGAAWRRMFDDLT